MNSTENDYAKSGDFRPLINALIIYALLSIGITLKFIDS